jgi:hypothetical protein
MLSARSRPRYDAPCTLRTRLSAAGRRGLAEPSGRGRSPDRQPDTYSTCAEIKSIARYLPPAWQALIVDDAWGAHSPFHQDLPTWAMDAGADVCVVSAHKMGTGFVQGSVFHRQGSLIDRTTRPPAPSRLLRTRRAYR